MSEKAFRLDESLADAILGAHSRGFEDIAKATIFIQVVKALRFLVVCFKETLERLFNSAGGLQAPLPLKWAPLKSQRLL